MFGINYICDSSSERMVVSIKRLKSSSLRLALAVSKSRNVSNGENFSSPFCRPVKNKSDYCSDLEFYAI